MNCSFVIFSISSLNSRTREGWTPLMAAVANGEHTYLSGQYLASWLFWENPTVTKFFQGTRVRCVRCWRCPGSTSTPRTATGGLSLRLPRRLETRGLKSCWWKSVNRDKSEKILMEKNNIQLHHCRVHQMWQKGAKA